MHLQKSFRLFLLYIMWLNFVSAFIAVLWWYWEILYIRLFTFLKYIFEPKTRVWVLFKWESFLAWAELGQMIADLSTFNLDCLEVFNVGTLFPNMTWTFFNNIVRLVLLRTHYVLFLIISMLSDYNWRDWSIWSTTPTVPFLWL